MPRMQHVPNQINNNKFVSFFFFLFSHRPFLLLFFLLLSWLFICLFVSFFTRYIRHRPRKIWWIYICVFVQELERERPPRASKNMSPAVYNGKKKERKPEGGNRKYSLAGYLVFGVPRPVYLTCIHCTLIGERLSNVLVCVSVCLCVCNLCTEYWSPQQAKRWTVMAFGREAWGDTRGLWWQSVRTRWCLRPHI